MLETQNWQSQGIIFNDHWAQCPTLLILDNVWRIYYSTRNENNKSYIQFIDVEPGNPKNVIYKHNEQILPLGQKGTFDVEGTTPTCIIKDNGQYLLYYIGWTERKDVCYQNGIGVATSTDGKTFTKYSEGAIISDNHQDPFFCGTFNVIRESRHPWDTYKGFYMSSTGWEIIDGKEEPKYLLKAAESSDGVNWTRGNICINYKTPTEAIANASVIHYNQNYYMWYCYRDIDGYRTDPNKSYKIGFAHSKWHNRGWQRRDDLVNLPRNNWDIEMQCYPTVIKHGNKLFMVYNGNGFGRSGIGYATLEIPLNQTKHSNTR